MQSTVYRAAHGSLYRTPNAKVWKSVVVRSNLNNAMKSVAAKKETKEKSGEWLVAWLTSVGVRRLRLLYVLLVIVA